MNVPAIILQGQLEVNKVQTLEVPIAGMYCTECTLHVQKAIAKLPEGELLKIVARTWARLTGQDLLAGSWGSDLHPALDAPEGRLYRDPIAHLLAIVAGNSAYAFALMLFAFLSGLGAMNLRVALQEGAGRLRSARLHVVRRDRAVVVETERLVVGNALGPHLSVQRPVGWAHAVDAEGRDGDKRVPPRDPRHFGGEVRHVRRPHPVHHVEQDGDVGTAARNRELRQLLQ